MNLPKKKERNKKKQFWSLTPSKHALCTFSIFPAGDLPLPLPHCAFFFFFKSPRPESWTPKGFVVQSRMRCKLAGAERPSDERGNEKEVSWVRNHSKGKWEGGVRETMKVKEKKSSKNKGYKRLKKRKKRVNDQTQTNAAFDFKRAEI